MIAVSELYSTTSVHLRFKRALTARGVDSYNSNYVELRIACLHTRVWPWYRARSLRRSDHAVEACGDTRGCDTRGVGRGGERAGAQPQSGVVRRAVGGEWYCGRIASGDCAAALVGPVFRSATWCHPLRSHGTRLPLPHILLRPCAEGYGQSGLASLHTQHRAARVSGTQEVAARRLLRGAYLPGGAIQLVMGRAQ